ncbi:MAG: PilZ domain-containing protein [Myxococcales bacterium]|nr:PilZ domain-containing protein [Myxococcales bacterium]
MDRVEANSQSLTSGAERRQHARHYLGLPIRVHFEGGRRSADIELADVSHGGGRFVGTPSAVAVGQSVAFGFVLPGPVSCVAAARVVRVDPGGFAVRLDRANEAFAQFVESLEGGAPRAA